MARAEKLIQEFAECNGPFPYKDFDKIRRSLGYEPIKTGKTSGASRKFLHPETQHRIYLHEPHDGTMGSSMVKRLQDTLRGQGFL